MNNFNHSPDVTAGVVVVTAGVVATAGVVTWEVVDVSVELSVAENNRFISVHNFSIDTCYFLPQCNPELWRKLIYLIF